MLSRLIKIFNEPFPETVSSKDDLKEIIYIGIFIVFFLFVFQPFGIRSYHSKRFIICLAFGVITVLSAISFHWMGDRVLKLERDVPSWTLWKWIIYMMVFILYVALWNWIFINFIEGGVLINWYGFKWMTISTVTVGIIPIIFSGILVQVRAQNKNKSEASDIQSHLREESPSVNRLRLLSQSQNQELEVDEDKLLFIEAMQNYVAVHLMKEGQVEKELIRNTLSAIEQQLAESPLIRCHRSFLVNTQLIEKVEGNAQGLRLHLKGLEGIEIPVSRKYIPKLREILQ